MVNCIPGQWWDQTRSHPTVAAGQGDDGTDAARQGAGIFRAAPELGAIQVTAEAVVALRA